MLEVIGEGGSRLGRDVDVIATLALPLHVPEILPVVLVHREPERLRDPHPGLEEHDRARPASFAAAGSPGPGGHRACRRRRARDASGGVRALSPAAR